MTHRHEIYGNSMQVWIFSCYDKTRRCINSKHRFLDRRHFHERVKQKAEFNFFSWRCTTPTRRRFIIASAWALLSLIFCSEADLGMFSMFGRTGASQTAPPPTKALFSFFATTNCQTAAAAIVVCIAERVLNKMSMMTIVRVGWRQSGVFIY